MHNKPRNEDFLNALMDPDQSFSRGPAFPMKEPSHVRKQSREVNTGKNQQLGASNPYTDHSTTPIYPPRTSSIRRFDPFEASRPLNESSAASSPARSIFSNYRGAHLSDTSADAPSTAHTAYESHVANCISNFTTGIMGDFIPIDQDDTHRSREPQYGKPFLDA